MMSPPFWVRERRDVVEATGADATAYLHGQLSQDVTSMTDGESRWTFVLAPTGKVDVLARVQRRDAEHYVFDTEAGFGEVLQARLARFKIRVAVELSAGSLDTIVTVGEGAAGGGGAAGGELVSWGDGIAVLLGAEPRSDVPEGTADDLAAARIEATWPAMGAEIVTGETIPAETGVTAVAVNFTKGCYPGQELVERMDSRGAKAPRRLVALDVDGTARAGDPIVRDGAEVGVLTTVVGSRALGYVRRNVEFE